MTSDLVDAIKGRRVILFVGAGVSAGLGVPTWSELIRHIGSDLGYDPEIFAGPDANYLTLAQYYKIEKGSIGPLRSWMDNNWNASDDIVLNSRVHELITLLNFPVIYTTNYDRNIETAYRIWGRKYRKIVDVRDLSLLEDGESQIIKLHGDFDNDSSIVLTETDYFDRLSFESPLDVRLRSDGLARSLFFVGYSLSDINIRLLLHKIWRTWRDSEYNDKRPRSYIFLPRPDPIQKTVLRQWGIEVLTEEVEDPRESLTTFLEKIYREASRGSSLS